MSLRRGKAVFRLEQRRSGDVGTLGNHSARHGGKAPCLAPIITAADTAGTIAGPAGRIAAAMEAHVKLLNPPTGTAICTISVLGVIMTGMLPA
ncbi:hypothetical protein WG31_14700 (plasmid) [Acetobacter oryzifermentans]|uniref:Uncharacterized protein n=1 Tax=Acetobacter oryzifermentans TaxID=1633874 RepID=A0ABM6ANV8_9PROT|nr:hypothetical protein WG31_14700 [Acetobacter oryzifermentans]